jgi:hypothetical protein
MATSLVPAGLTSSLKTLVVPPLWVPLNGRLRFGSTLPVVSFTAASLARLWPLMVPKLPPTNSRPPRSARSRTRPEALAVNAVSRWPLLTASLVSRLTVAPLTLVKAPPTNTDWPSEAGSRAFTAALRLGAKLVSIAPVAGSKAKMLLRAMMAPPPRRTWVKHPLEDEPSSGCTATPAPGHPSLAPGRATSSQARRYRGCRRIPG